MSLLAKVHMYRIYHTNTHQKILRNIIVAAENKSTFCGFLTFSLTYGVGIKCFTETVVLQFNRNSKIQFHSPTSKLNAYLWNNRV